MFGPQVESRDGYESQFATNYLGHFLLTHLLLNELKKAGSDKSRSRVVNVSSCAHVVGQINFEDINFRLNIKKIVNQSVIIQTYRSQYIPAEAYAQSKLAQILFSNYLNELLTKEGAFVQVHSVHPGIVNTDLFNDTNLKTIAPWMPSLFFKVGFLIFITLSLQKRLICRALNRERYQLFTRVFQRV